MAELDQTQTKDQQNSVSSDVTKPLEKIGEVIKGLAAKNATMKDGKPNSSDKKDGRPPTTTEERVAAYDKYKNDVSKAFDRNTAADGSIDSTGLALDVGQAIADLAVAAGPELFKLGVEALSKLKPK